MWKLAGVRSCFLIKNLAVSGQICNFATDFYKLTPCRALRAGWEWTHKKTVVSTKRPVLE